MISALIFSPAPDRLGNHLGTPRGPCQLGHGRGELLLTRQLLEAVAPGRKRVLGAVRVEHERRLFLPRVEHLAERIGQPDGAGHHDHGRLAGGFDVAGRHRGAGTFMRREDVLQLRPVHERFIELGILARRIAEDVLHAGRDELLGKRLAARALEHLHGVGRDRGARGLRERVHRLQDGRRGSHGDAARNEAAHEITPRDAVGQKLRDELFHGVPRLAASAGPRICAR